MSLPRLRPLLALLALAGCLAPDAGASESGMDAIEQRLKRKGIRAHVFALGTRSLHVAVTPDTTLSPSERDVLCEAVAALASELVPERTATIEIHLGNASRAEQRHRCPRSEAPVD